MSFILIDFISFQEAKKEAEEARNALEIAEAELEKEKEEKTTLKKEAEVKIQELKDELSVAKKQADKDAEDLERLRKELVELKDAGNSAPISELQKQIAQLQTERDDALNEVKEAYQLGEDSLAATFKNALEQVPIFQTRFVADENILKHDHSVLGDKIVLLDPNTNQGISVIYPPNTSK